MTTYIATDPITTLNYRDDKPHRTVKYRATRGGHIIRGVCTEELFKDAKLFHEYIDRRFARLTLPTQAAS